ncbi:MAG: hypothetical protein JNM71_16390 [Flavobacterium lindanitolerans]|jgi:hypothetical protein|uniref:hypothetical protein n=1 Tax=Flavobacterium lindanitolerans TaxID=428988 RepID=UPI001A4F7844|nr:hypothetical protein [Flavobacterium lindanitolerans]MBL7869594.1 hypothetical protein [Flavobacterium lindanitolerans]
MKKLFILLISVASFISCSDVDGVTYNDSSTYLGFQASTYNLPVVVNSSSTVDIKFVASSKSNVARTYNLSVVTEESNADPLTYSVPATITIPANSYEGVATITGTDNGLLDFVVKKLVLEVSGLNAKESTDTERITINMYEVCPLVMEDFVGVFSGNLYYWDNGDYDIIEGSAPNTLEIVDFFPSTTNPNLVLTYDADNNVTFADQNTGYYDSNGGFLWLRMSAATVGTSKIDPCTNKITLKVKYYIPNLGAYPDGEDIFTKQ